MSVAPNSHEDHHPDAGSGRASRSSTLPPVLFQLPNLSASDDACAAAEVVEQEPTTNEDVPTANRAETETPKTAQPPTATAVPETTPVPTEIGESAAEVTSEPAAAKHNDESLFDIWGTRAVVVALLMLVIGSAFVAARKTQNGSEQAVAVDAGVSIDDIEAIENFAVTEGVEAAASHFDNIVVAADPVLDEAAPEMASASSDELASNTTLGEPTVSLRDDRELSESPAAQAVADTNNDAEIGHAAQVPASLASSRTETPEPIDLSVAALKPADPETPTANPARAEIQVNVFGLDTEVATPGDSATDSVPTEPSAGPSEDNAAAVGQVAASSGEIRYSSTPNGVSDWTQYLPTVPTTTAPQSP